LQITDFMAHVSNDAAVPMRISTSKYLLAGSRASWTLAPAVDLDSVTSLNLHGFSDRGEINAEIPLEKK
jgi:hypothetical protein